MADLWALIESLVGKELAEKGKRSFDGERYFQRLPKGVTNVESQPQLYIDSKQPVTVVPRDKFFEEAGGAGGTHSPLGGIRLPDYIKSARMQLPMTLSHENFHAKDKGSSRENSERLAKVAEILAESRAYMPPGITGQTGADELMAQMVGAESMMPSGMKALQSPEIRKAFSPMDMAAYLERRYPKPANVDAMTGLPE